MALQPATHRFSVADYHRMGEAGILDEDDRVELLEGQVVEMAPIGPGHADRVDRLIELFVLSFSEVAFVRSQNPILLDPYSEPQPDLALVRRRPGGYAAHHPTPEDVLLLVEVSEGSAPSDRRRKVPLYARHGIPEVWLVSLPEQTVTLYRDPAPAGYRAEQVLGRGDRIAPLSFPDRELDVSSILGTG